MELFELEGNLKSGPTPYSEQGHLQLDKVAQNMLQGIAMSYLSRCLETLNKSLHWKKK